MRINEPIFRKLYQEHQESSLSVRDFCANQDLTPATYYRWKKIVDQKQIANGFVPLIIRSPQSNNNKLQIPAICEDIANNEVSLEFVFPNSTKLVLKANIDMALLKSIVHLY